MKTKHADFIRQIFPLNLNLKYIYSYQLFNQHQIFFTDHFLNRREGMKKVVMIYKKQMFKAFQNFFPSTEKV